MHFLPKICLKIEHPVPWLFLGGLTTQTKRLEPLFSVVQSQKFYLKHCVQGEQK